MRADRRRRIARVLATAVMVGVLAGSGFAQAPERHGKGITQCNAELKANTAALAKAGESPAEFFHDCWWRTKAGHATRIRGMASGATVARSEPGADKAQADAEVAKAKQEADTARRQAAAAEAEAAKARKAMTIEASKAAAATEAAKASQARAAEAEAKMQAQADAKVRAEARKAAAETKAKASAEAAQVARVRAATEALQKAKAEQAARVEAAAADLAAAKAQQLAGQPITAEAAPMSKPRARPDKAATKVQASVRPRRVARVRRLAFAPRRFVMSRPSVVPPLQRRRLYAAAARPAPPAAATASPGLVRVPVQIPGLGLRRPIEWPVLPAYVPAFRSVVNNPIVPGFTKTP